MREEKNRRRESKSMCRRGVWCKITRKSKQVKRLNSKAAAVNRLDFYEEASFLFPIEKTKKRHNKTYTKEKIMCFCFLFFSRNTVFFKNSICVGWNYASGQPMSCCAGPADGSGNKMEANTFHLKEPQRQSRTTNKVFPLKNHFSIRKKNLPRKVSSRLNNT